MLAYKAKCLAAAMTMRDKPTYECGGETYQLDDPLSDAIDTMLNEQVAVSLLMFGAHIDGVGRIGVKSPPLSRRSRPLRRSC